MRKFRFFFVILLISLTGCKSTTTSELVKVECGLLQGTNENGVSVFKGIPYARPPIGKLRWCPPLSPLPWEGVRTAANYGANAIQVMVNEYGPWTSEYQPQGKTSEDCLYLNIWTTAKSTEEKRPVVVYIPGGAFTGGSGNVPIYNGENLAKKGIVVVTINYRVGVLGFLAHPELTEESENNSSGNYGLLDQLEALKWVKRNIASFGGDPYCVTIMGQSAGAASVHYLTASPLAKGLFTRAIAQSGSHVWMGPGEELEEAEKKGIEFGKAVNALSLDDLRALSAEKLLEVSRDTFSSRPIVDGWYLTKSVDEIFEAGEQIDVATLTGLVADEGSYSDNYGKASAEKFRSNIKQQVSKEADKILKFYPASTDLEASESQKMLSREMSMVSMYLWAKRRQKNSNSDLYTYIFTHQQPGETRDKYLAFHSSELPYIFDNLNYSPRPWKAEDDRIAQVMSNYWVNFISTGNPNGDGVMEWPKFNVSSKEVMELGDKMGIRPVTNPEKFELLVKLQ